MAKAKELLYVGDELNLYLVANGLKPASMVYIDPRNPQLDGKVSVSEEIRGNARYNTFRLNSIDVEVVRNFLNDLGVKYLDWEEESVSDLFDSKGNIAGGTISTGQHFYVGFNQENLEKLVSAKECEEKGRALGFPDEAVQAYRKIIDGERRDGSYVSVSMARAKLFGLELPTWLAYICFVPESLDLIHSNVSQSSEALARKYQEFVRANNPELARRVEQHFSERELPDSWMLERDGGYLLRFNPKPSPVEEKK